MACVNVVFTKQITLVEIDDVTTVIPFDQAFESDILAQIPEGDCANIVISGPVASEVVQACNIPLSGFLTYTRNADGMGAYSFPVGACITAGECDDCEGCDTSDYCIPTTDTPALIEIEATEDCFKINFVGEIPDSDDIGCEEIVTVTPNAGTLIQSADCTQFPISDLCDLLAGCVVGGTGEPGADGGDGVPGNDGIDGVDGLDGADGADGAQGDSAYDIWILEGNVGTFTDFLNSLNGTNGINGVDGDDGINGIDGVTPLSGDHITVDPDGTVNHQLSGAVFETACGFSFDLYGHFVAFNGICPAVIRRYSGDISIADVDIDEGVTASFPGGAVALLFDVAAPSTGYMVTVVDVNGQVITDAVITAKTSAGFTLTTAYVGDVFINIVE